MNAKVLKTLEFDKMIDRLSELAYSSMAKEKIKNIKPSSDIEEVLRMQKETSSARDMITHKSYPSFADLEDMTDVFQRLDIDAVLSISEILKALKLLECTSSVKQYYNESGLKEVTFERLFINLTTLIDLQNEIRRCIVSEDEIADDASIELRNIRRQIKVLQGRVKEKLNEMVNSQTYKSMLQEPVVTFKQNRYCLPVKVEFKSQLKGVVHEESASGQTVFVEPLQVVEINNKIKEFEKKEEEEIERILFRLSYDLKENYEVIENDYNILILLDVIFAKGKFSKELDGVEPKINTNGYINLKLARHPLIDKDKIVPINVELGKKYKSLIITGPNTGGKTVTLKTIGLCELLGLSGLHIPCFDGSEISMFNEIFGDIGDEQSIEQSLSTFSSHMTNLVDITNKVDENSLVLIDEIGAGTDPIEGAALAISILKFLKDNNASIVATTHYSELKHYALTEEGVINASCEFDVNTLMPTYKLLIGIPGKSNAFEISKKLGLSDYIINKAKENLDSDSVSFEDAIKAASDEKERAEREADLAQAYKEEIKLQKEDYEKRIQKLKEEKEKVLNDARREALVIVEEAKEKSKEIITKLKEKAKEVHEQLNAKDMSELKAELEKNSRELE
ncbi:MAG: endonuclease MutS2, partial [Clostridia bacterium]|nr:endonuclease MutS2 [Clostridia bacterium]